MYKVIGSDQKEYGPLSTEQVAAWINQRRLDGHSRIQGEGDTTWRSVSEFPEFAAALAAQPMPSGVPPLSASEPAKPKTSGLAIASLVLGVLGLPTCGISALAGLVLGVVALIKINKSQGRLSGSGLAIGGLCASGLFLLMIPILAAILLPALATAKSKAQAINCMNNVKQLNLAIHLYADDNDNRLPSAGRWCDAIQGYTKGSPSVFHCPTQPARDCSYAFNAKLEGKKLSDLSAPAQTVLVFESNAGLNKAGGPELAAPNHSKRFVCVGFVDGHAELAEAARLDSLQWQP